MSPKVSVIMSVYNGEKYLRESIDSMLGQTFTNFEFIIINDGSTDSTPTIINSYTDPRILCLHNKQNIGLTRSLNRGLKLARGEFVARQDSDDVSLPDRLATQISYLQRNKQVGLLGTAYYVIDSQGTHTNIFRQPETDSQIRWQMLFLSAFCHTSVMFRSKFFVTCESVYDESLQYSQDFELWTRLLSCTNVANLQIPLVKLRIHEDRVTSNCYKKQQQIASEIAAKQINSLFKRNYVNLYEVQSLRQWYNRFPNQWNKKDMGLCRILLKILDEFEKQDNVDYNIMKKIRARLNHRILSSIPYNQLIDLLTSGLFLSMCCNDFTSVLNHFFKKVVRRIGGGIFAK